jgi:glycosyltransferase involved in cell wall biosynthesis
MVIQSFLPVLGGAQRQVDLLGPLLARRGVDLTVLTRRPPGTVRREQRAGLEVQRLPGPDRGPLGSVSYTAAGTLSLARLRPDVVHVHDLLSPATIALLSRPLVRAPIVAKVLSTGPGGDVDRLLTKPLGARRLQAMASSFSAFVCLSDDVAEELRLHGVREDRLWKIPNGVDVECFRPADPEQRKLERSRLGLPAAGPVALYTGRFAPVKQLDQLIKAVSKVPELSLIMVGEGSEEARLRSLVADLGLGDRVYMLASVPDPAPLYRAADFYASTSTTEGMSNSVLEAMASGLPVVAMRASGMGELVSQATGSLVPSGDVAALAAALQTFALEPERRHTLGSAARDLVADRYSLGFVADRLHDLYAEVLPGPEAQRKGQE